MSPRFPARCRAHAIAALGTCLVACAAEPDEPTGGAFGDPCGHDHHCADALVCTAGTCDVRDVADAGSADAGASDDDAPAECMGDSLVQHCDDEAECCGGEQCMLFSGVDGARCSARCGTDGDCLTGCCQDGWCVPEGYCPGPSGDPCSECLDSCREAMLPNCCTGLGCVCDSEC